MIWTGSRRITDYKRDKKFFWFPGKKCPSLFILTNRITFESGVQEYEVSKVPE